MTLDERPLTVPQPRQVLRRTVRHFALAITLVVVLLGVVVGYQVFRLRTLVLRTSKNIEPLLLTNETIALIERAGHVLRDVQASLDDPEVTRSQQILWSEQLVALHSALESNRRELEAFLDALPPDDPLLQPLARSWALLREINRLIQEITQAVNHGRWNDANALIRRFFDVYNEYHLTQRFLLQRFEARRDVTLQRMLRALSRILFQPAMTALVSLILVWLFARFVVRRIIRPLEDTAEGVLRFAEGDYNYRLEVDERAEDEVTYLRRVFNVMAERVQASQLTLEQRVAERTYALQRRVAQIQAAADVARLLTSLRSPDLLLERTARLIAERFGFYHVGIFLLDETGEWMELRAASSEGGQRLLERHHRLRVGQEGVVGFVARTGNPRIVLDVEEDPHYVRPPELALTRSEMALPLRVGGRILGVLDIQSTQPNAFTPEDVTTLRVVADQLAVALDNAFLLQRMERALDELHWVQRQLSRRGWEEFLRVAPAQVFHRTARGEFEALPPTAQATVPASEPDLHELRLPIAVREQPIAVLHLRRAEPWNEAERQMLRDLADRLGLALESARLFYVAQRRTAWLQAAVELGRTLRTWDEETLLREFVRALLERFPLGRAVLYVYQANQLQLEAHAAAGDQAEALLTPKAHQVSLRSEDPLAVAARRREPVLLNTPEAMQAYADSAPVPPGGSRLVLPILLGEQLFGVLDLHAERPRAFLEADITVLRLLVDSLGVALLNARLVARLRVLLGEQQRLQAALAQATAAASVQEALDVVVQALYELEHPQAVAFYLSDEEDPYRLVRVAERHDPEMRETWPEAVRLDDTEHPVVWAFLNQGALWFNTLHWRDQHMQARSAVLVVPIVYGDEPLGVVAFRHARANAYSEDFWGLVHTAAAAVGSLLSNLRLLEQVQRRSAQLQLLYDFTVAISRYTDFQTLVREAIVRLRTVFDAMHGGILIYDPVREVVRLVAAASRSADAPGAEWQPFGLPATEGTPFARLRAEPRVLVVPYDQLKQADPTLRTVM
ncbi:MAG: GAF domain-containing protein, partial [Chloroflexi bacterium]|nr:GAF domain-containing protein [Chloroflexota bacterium]